MVSLLRVELLNIERRASTAAGTLKLTVVGTQDLLRTRFPEGGLLSLGIRALFGHPPALVQDLATLVLNLRNLNVTINHVTVREDEDNPPAA